jgi:PAS domain S-box-containing protein
MPTPHILIVDDNPKNIQLAASVLKESIEAKIIFAQSAEQAYERLQEYPVSLILLDIQMPQTDGLTAARTIRSDDRYLEIPIIFLTASHDADTLDAAFIAGAKDYITKPFNANELTSRVKTHLELFCAKKRLQESFDSQQVLLEQYKKIVDISTIMSKTDLQGNITYINDKFCEISGYKPDELIGKPHNIVRHSDMSKESFADMWNTIKSKKVWHGQVKNRKKNGEEYIVQSVVMPILDKNNDVSEFISLRHDVTELVMLRREVEATQQEIVLKLAELSEHRSKETGEHVRRVAEYAYVLARAYGISEEEAGILKDASPMHDIGKVSVPDSILLKPSSLTGEEFEVIKAHTTVGHEVFASSGSKILRAASTTAYEHHEKWDGTGYPRGLAGEDIHIYGRIVAVADVYDALSHDRVYKTAWEPSVVQEYIKEQSGKQFDPKVVECFFENLTKIETIRDSYRDNISFK